MNQAELEQLARDGEMMIAAFAKVVASMPPQGQGIGPMSRFLGVHKGTCQKVVEGATASNGGLHAFARFPGVSALTMYLDACKAHGIPSDAIHTAEVVVRRLGSILERYDVSQRGLLDLIAAAKPGESDSAIADRSHVERRALFAAAKRVTGESMESKIAVATVMPHPTMPGKLRIVGIVMMQGVHREPYARPISATIHPASPRNVGPNDPSPVPQVEVVADLSTTGLDSVTVGVEKVRTALVINTDHVEPMRRGKNQGVDVALLFRSDAAPDPRMNNNAHVGAAMRVLSPTRRLWNAVCVHKDLVPKGAGSTVRGGCFTLTAPPGDHADGTFEHCAHERFPEEVRIERFNPQGPARDPASRVAKTLAGRIFERERYEHKDFLCWSCSVAYPLWQTEYRMYIA